MAPVVQLDEIHKIYSSGEVPVHAVRGVTLTIQRGEFVAVMGSSGSGKSTLMNTLGCLDRPTSGQYILDGQDVSRMSKDQLAEVRNQKIGFVFQGFNLLSRTSALDNVELPLLYRSKMKASERRRLAMESLAAVGLDERADHHPNQLSGGQQQRVAIARALITRPSILLADEPTGNLDGVNGQAIMDLLFGLRDRHGATLVLVTHAPELAQRCDRVIRLADGLLAPEAHAKAAE